jgi:hypothetical protein
MITHSIQTMMLTIFAARYLRLSVSNGMQTTHPASKTQTSECNSLMNTSISCDFKRVTHEAGVSTRREIWIDDSGMLLRP